MLIDYLEEKSAFLAEKKDKYRALSMQYKKFYSRDLRDEMGLLKKEMGRLEHEASEQLYENLEELKLIKSYFPDLYAILLEDACIGKIITRKDWLLDQKGQDGESPAKELERIKQKRKELSEAKKFVQKWPAERIDSKSITATWPALKNKIKGTADKDDIVRKIEDSDRELRRSGWLVLLDKSMADVPVNAFLRKLGRLISEEEMKKAGISKSRGKGSVKEHAAMAEYRNAKKERKKCERMLRHILIASKGYLDRVRAEKKQKGRELLHSLAQSVKTKKINEKEWLAGMRKRLEP